MQVDLRRRLSYVCPYPMDIAGWINANQPLYNWPDSIGWYYRGVSEHWKLCHAIQAIRRAVFLWVSSDSLLLYISGPRMRGSGSLFCIKKHKQCTALQFQERDRCSPINDRHQTVKEVIMFHEIHSKVCITLGKISFVISTQRYTYIL